jgi:hypothetical protein
VTVTTLDAKTALVIIDLLKGIVSLPTAHPRLGETGATQEIIDR